MTCEIDNTDKLLQWLSSSVLAYLTTWLVPAHDFMLALVLFATWNMVWGLIADCFKFSFWKAFKTFLYLIGFLFLICMTIIGGSLIRLSEGDIHEVVFWETCVMLWFYITNILRNWTIFSPDNKVIGFIYWVVSFKIVEKIKFLNEYISKNEKNGDTKGA